MDVRTIAVIGAGAVGREIACVAAVSGFRTILEDMSAPRLEDAWAWIHKFLDEGVASGKLSVQQKSEGMADLSTARCVEDASRDADLVIEAAPDDVEMKIEIFTLLDKFAKPGSIFASTALSLPIAEIAAMTFRPEKCVGMRFSNHVPDGKLLEIVCVAQTSPDTIDSCRELGRRIGAEVAVVYERQAMSAT